MTKKNPVVKVFIRIALIAICVTVVSPFVMYFWANSNLPTNCDEWYIRNDETQECEEDISGDTWDTETKIDTQESCEAQSWTWYEANQICILPTE